VRQRPPVAPRYVGCPSPSAFVYGIGVLELAGGFSLATGALTRLAAIALIGDMIGAIGASGIGEGEVVPSLTLAPALLVAMLFLLWTGPGSQSLLSAPPWRLATAAILLGSGSFVAAPGTSSVSPAPREPT
jgi:uncharacterized membrane protein YphA (DoxX/SURF4 family)